MDYDDVIREAAKAAQAAVENAPFLDFKTWSDDGDDIPMTYRKYFEESWLADKSERAFSEAATAAIRAAFPILAEYGARLMREAAADRAYMKCAQTRHVTLGDACRQSVRALDPATIVKEAVK